MELFEPARHVSSPADAWDPKRVRGWLCGWAAAALAGRDERGCWAPHPRDLVDVGAEPRPLRCLYFGAAGVWLALARLADAGLCHLPVDLAEVLERIGDDYVHSPDTEERAASWFLGEAGLLTLLWWARRDEATAERLAAVIRGNRDNPTREALWGAPGTMEAALFLYEATAEARWAEVYADSVAAIWASWTRDEATGVWLWEQDMYGERTRYFGAGHGWAGNLHALWRGHALLSPAQQDLLRARTLAGLEGLAMVAGERANWPALVGRSDKSLVQWCHGAPGFITSLRHAALPEALPLLIKGANLIAEAGPLIKGVALCHGTDGNGAALLEMYRRTGDGVWLAQARRFAMAAIGQSEASRAETGSWRQSLWTGDAGLACWLLDCLDGRSRGMPGLDSLW